MSKWLIELFLLGTPKSILFVSHPVIRCSNITCSGQWIVKRSDMCHSHAGAFICWHKFFQVLFLLLQWLWKQILRRSFYQSLSLQKSIISRTHCSSQWKDSMNHIFVGVSHENFGVLLQQYNLPCSDLCNNRGNGIYFRTRNLWEFIFKKTKLYSLVIYREHVH